MAETQRPRDRFVRSRSDRVFAGVCGGLAAYLGVDATLVRVAWVVVALVALPVGLVAYVLLWLLAPEESDLTGDELGEGDRQPDGGPGPSRDR